MPMISFDAEQGKAVYDGIDEITFSRQPYALNVKGYDEGDTAVIQNFNIVNLYKPNFLGKLEHLYELWCFLNGKDRANNFLTTLLFGKRREIIYGSQGSK